MFRGCLFLLAALTLSGVVPAQQPTAEQIEMLRNLTPEQRAALEKQVNPEGADNASDKTKEPAKPEDGLPAEDEPLPLDEESRQELLESRRPILRGEDSIIIEIDLDLQPQDLAGAQRENTMVPGTTLDDAVRDSGSRDPMVRSQSGRLRPPLTRSEIDRLLKMRELIVSKNPYRLTRDGFLLMPGFAPVPLGGLTEEQATLRMSVEVEFRDLKVRVRRLPVRRIGVEALKPFGYELFDRSASTFRPVTDVPVPSDYVVGPGDEIEVQLYGSQNRTLHLTVGRDGRISFPELGPISVGGQAFSAVKSNIESRVARQMIGVRASVTVGDTRSIRIFVLGEARRPGSYTISGLGTMTSALFAAGGVRPIGSLRNVQLKRNGSVVRAFDLYDMLLRGDTTDDAKLLPGDVVFIPPIGPVVSVDGEVRRPAIYETRDENTVADMIGLAGGLTPEADLAKAALTRIDESGKRSVLAVDLSARGGTSQRMRNGDLLRISRLRPTLDSGIALEGHVHAPGAFAYHEGLRLTDVVRSVDDLKPNADIHYILIRRELPPDRHISVLSADFAAATNAPDSAANVLLMPRDRLIVFDRETGRDRIIRPLLDEIRLQADFANPTGVVTIDGRAKIPGTYPLEPGMTVRDLVRAGGSLSDAAFGGSAELTRYKIIDGGSRQTELVLVDLAAALRDDPAANLRLQPFDTLNIKEVPDWREQGTVELRGEVRFPGRYAIGRGETLKSVLTRAGGLSDLAFPAGSVFTREELRAREQQQINVLTDRLQKDLAFMAVQGAVANQSQAGGALAFGETLMTQLRASKAIGRLVIDLTRVVASQDSADDIMLRDGDTLMVPKLRQEVTVIGEVQTATSHLFKPTLTRDDYVGLSGGPTRKADKKRTYVVRADGSVVADGGSSWFSRGAQVSMQPGDTVVVPLDTERMPALPFWQAVTQILYNLAITAAAVNSF